MKRILASCAWMTLAWAGFGNSSHAETLTDALSSAYANNPTLRAARAALRAVDEQVPQARSGYRPDISAFGEAGLEKLGVSPGPDQDLVPRALGVEINQPIYRGGRTVAGTRQAQSLVLAGREDLNSTEQDVLLAAVIAYLDVLRDQARVDLNDNNVVVLRRQLDATQDRFNVGELTRTDVAQAEARLTGAIGDLEVARGDLAATRATYERVIGQFPGTLEPAPPLPPLPGSLQEAIDIATKNNPQVLAAAYSEEAAGHGVRVAIGTLLPSVSLVGTIQTAEDQTVEGLETDSSSIIARVTVPLYQAGLASSQVREAKELRNQRRIQIEEARRFVVENVTQAWEVLQATRATITSRREQVRAAEIALEGVRQEAAVGARTTLDVLDQEQELLNARVSLVFAQRDEYVAGYQLLSAVGRLSAQFLDLPIDVYDPTVHYREVENKWWGLAISGEE